MSEPDVVLGQRYGTASDVPLEFPVGPRSRRIPAVPGHRRPPCGEDEISVLVLPELNGPEQDCLSGGDSGDKAPLLP